MCIIKIDTQKCVNNSKDDAAMTIQKLKALTEHLPADTIVLIDLPDRTSDVETINIQYHTDGRAHLILSNKE